MPLPRRRSLRLLLALPLLLAGACAQRVAAPAAESLLLGELAATRPAAARVFLAHRIDFCCGGGGTLGEAARARGLTAQALLDEIAAAEREHPEQDEARWAGRPAEELIAHIVARYHADLRTDLPRLLELARTVERVHAERDDRPVGLPEHLADVSLEVLRHLEDEEQRVFPAILASRARRTDPGVVALVRDHDALGHALARTRDLTRDFTAPPDACPTWRALYAGLRDLERAIMLHAHLENNVLIPALPVG